MDKKDRDERRREPRSISQKWTAAVAALMLLLGGGLGIGRLIGNKGTGNENQVDKKETVNTASVIGNNSSNTLTAGQDYKEIYITVRENRFFIDDKEYTADTLTEFLNSTDEKTLFIMRDDKAIKKTFDDVMRLIKEKNFPVKVMMVE